MKQKLKSGEELDVVEGNQWVRSRMRAGRRAKAKKALNKRLRKEGRHHG